jgi:hypothetical protein
LDQIAAKVAEPETVNPPAWNHEQFYKLVRNNEIEILATTSDEDIETRILALQELEKQSKLLIESIRIRIQTNLIESEERGVKAKIKRSQRDMAYTPVLPSVSSKLTKLEKAKASLNELGIDFDSFMFELKAKSSSAQPSNQKKD